jgi:hypothetical protein
MTKSRRRAFTLAMVVLVAGFFVAIELSVRALYRHKRVAVQALLFATGPLELYGEELGWSLNARVVQRIRTRFGDVVTYRTGIHGFRIEEGQDLSGGEVDVLFVGDSVTFGTDANKSSPLEFARISHLKAVNAGVPGYGTDQAFLMARKAIEGHGLRPRRVIYGFYYNDIANNVSDVATDFDRDFVVHKPILDRATGLYQRAEVEKNDLTNKYRTPTVGEASQVILSQSQFLLALGRVLKYDLLQGLLAQSRPRPKFDEVAQSYLAANLEQFVALLRSHHTEFVVLHIRGGHVALEQQLAQWLSVYCETKSIRYIRPQLEANDYLPTNFHLSDQGATRVATTLWNEFQ